MPRDLIGSDCAADVPWLQRHGGDRLSSVVTSEGAPAQVELLSDLIDRPRYIDEVAAAWESLPQARDKFRTALEAWADVQKTCLPNGCEFQLVVGGKRGTPALSTAQPWSDVRIDMLRSWFNLFSSTDAPSFSPGCKDAFMTIDGSQWVYRNESSCEGTCLSFGPSSDTAEAAEQFAMRTVL